MTRKRIAVLRPTASVSPPGRRNGGAGEAHASATADEGRCYTAPVVATTTADRGGLFTGGATLH